MAVAVAPKARELVVSTLELQVAQVQVISRGVSTPAAGEYDWRTKRQQRQDRQQVEQLLQERGEQQVQDELQDELRAREAPAGSTQSGVQQVQREKQQLLVLLKHTEWHLADAERRLRAEKQITDSVLAATERAAAIAKAEMVAATEAEAEEEVTAGAMRAVVTEEATIAEEALAAKRELAAAIARKQSKEKQLRECTPTELERRAKQREHQRSSVAWQRIQDAEATTREAIAAAAAEAERESAAARKAEAIQQAAATSLREAAAAMRARKAAKVKSAWKWLPAEAGA